MENSLKASYRLVYFQPKPEDGERICVALLLSYGRDVELLYYPDFPRLKCLSPRIDPQLIQFYLDDMASTIRDNPEGIESHIKRHTPHLLASAVRRVAWPLTDEAKIYLMKRFLGVEGKNTQVVEARVPQVDYVKEHLRQLIQRAKVRNEDLKEDAKPEWILGRRVRYIKKVAFALRRADGVLLIDGVDLSVLPAQSAVTRVGKVKHTFWQYGQLRQMEFGSANIKRIGVVLNGVTSPGADYKDAHDFALHEFRQEADVTVDSASPSDLNTLQKVLTG
jgi:hypothetical protein